jgi:hypothetical protein
MYNSFTWSMWTICVYWTSACSGVVTSTETSLKRVLRVRIFLYVYSHTTINFICVPYYYMCPHTTTCVLILLHVSSYICVPILLRMCPHTTTLFTHYHRVIIFISITRIEFTPSNPCHLIFDHTAYGHLISDKPSMTSSHQSVTSQSTFCHSVSWTGYLKHQGRGSVT